MLTEQEELVAEDSSPEAIARNQKLAQEVEEELYEERHAFVGNIPSGYDTEGNYIAREYKPVTLASDNYQHYE